MDDPNSVAEIQRIEKIFADPDFNVERVLEYIDPNEFVSFDFMYNIVGKQAHEAHLRAMLEMMGSGTNEIVRMEIHAGSEHGFVNSIQHLKIFDKQGNQVYDGNLRVTICYLKRDGKWMQVAQHASVPLDMATGAPDLKSTW